MPGYTVKGQGNDASLAEWPTVKATSMVNGSVVGASPGPSPSEIVATVPSDGVSVINLDKTVVQSWVFGEEGEEESTPTGAACFQKHGGFFCVPMRQRGGRGRKTRDFVYIWSMKDVESKNIRHVSKRVELAGEVSHVLPVKCPRKKSQSRGFFIVLKNGNCFLLDADTGRVETQYSDPSIEGNTVLFASSVADGLVIVHGDVSSKKKSPVTYCITRIMFTSYPHMEVDGTCQLLLGANATSVEGVACDGKSRVSIISPTGDLMVYQLPEHLKKTQEIVLEPKMSRTLVAVADEGSSAKKKKRRHAGNVNSEYRVFMDDFSRIFVLQNVHLDSTRLCVVDAQYGSVLWSGLLDMAKSRSGDPVAQVIFHGESSVDVIVSCNNDGILHANMNIQKPALSTLVGSLNIQSTFGQGEVRNSLAMNARRALDLEANSLVMAKTKQLGRVQISLEPGEGRNDLVHTPAKLSWEPAMNKKLLAVESEIIAILEDIDNGLKMDAKTKSKLLKSIITGLDQCKKSKCSLSSNVAARVLFHLIELKQWDSVRSLLHYSHPRSLSHCPGVALVLAEKARYSDLFSLLSQASDIRSSELCSVIKALIGGSGSSVEKSRESYMGSLSSYAEEKLKALEKKSKNTPLDQLSDQLMQASCSAAAVHGFSKRQVSCHPVLTLFPNSILISMALKTMHSEYLIFLVRYLLQWVSNIIDLDVPGGGTIPNLTCVPSLETVLVWLSAAMDAGNMRLTNSEKGLETLNKLMDEVNELVACLTTFEHLAGALLHVQNASPPEQRPNNAPGYKIQCLSL